jgi:hypothetical protein
MIRYYSRNGTREEYHNLGECGRLECIGFYDNEKCTFRGIEMNTDDLINLDFTNDEINFLLNKLPDGKIFRFNDLFIIFKANKKYNTLEDINCEIYYGLAYYMSISRTDIFNLSQTLKKLDLHDNCRVSINGDFWN